MTLLLVKNGPFSTLFARTLSQIGGKLHYGHPDFINSIYMNTRGGISKAQKGLHLNEDIYAGMNALLRGVESNIVNTTNVGKGRFRFRCHFEFHNQDWCWYG